MLFLILILLLMTVVYILFTDITKRQIYNNQVMAILVLSLVCSGLTAFAPLPYLLAVITGLVLYAIGVFAGGDIKLILAFLPAIQLQYWSLVLMLIAIVGGILAIGYLAYGWSTKQMQEVRERGLPYGVPIALSGYIGVFLSLF